MQIAGDSTVKWRLAIGAGVISVVVAVALAVGSSMRRGTPEMSVTPLPAAPPSSVVVAPAPTDAIEVVPPPPTDVAEPVPPPSELAPLPSAVEAADDTTAPTVEAPRPRAPALSTLSEADASRARECLAHNDYACALAIYRTSRDPHDLRRVVDVLDHVGRHREALGAMQDFVRRFPRASESAGYRSQLAAAGM
jgi:hypothetical protein